MEKAASRIPPDVWLAILKRKCRLFFEQKITVLSNEQIRQFTRRSDRGTHVRLTHMM